MTTWWPWFAVAGLGALHGLSPAAGWMFAAACGVQARDARAARRALLPIALGHGVSIALVVFALAQGVLFDRTRVRWLAGALLVGLALVRCARRGRPSRATQRTSHAGIALWSCLMATAHGAGLMLVPALGALCTSDSPARDITASGSLGLAFAAVVLHLAALLATTWVVALGVARGLTLGRIAVSERTLRQGWTVVLAVTGGVLMVR